MSGSRPLPMVPQEPSDPLPFFAAVHAWHVAVHAELQQTPSAQLKLWQSLPARQRLAMAQAVTWPEKARVTVSATDDGKPQNPATKKPEGLNLRWRKYRGPQTGDVTFVLGSAPASVGQKWTTEVSFSEPGEYVLQAVVDDSSLLSGTYCCWVNTEVKVTVKAAGKRHQP